MPIVVAVDPA